MLKIKHVLGPLGIVIIFMTIKHHYRNVSRQGFVVVVFITLHACSVVLK